MKCIIVFCTPLHLKKPSFILDLLKAYFECIENAKEDEIDNELIRYISCLETFRLFLYFYKTLFCLPDESNIPSTPFQEEPRISVPLKMCAEVDNLVDMTKSNRDSQKCKIWQKYCIERQIAKQRRYAKSHPYNATPIVKTLTRRKTKKKRASDWSYDREFASLSDQSIGDFINTDGRRGRKRNAVDDDVSFTESESDDDNGFRVRAKKKRYSFDKVDDSESMTSGDESSSEPEREVSFGLKRKRFDDDDGDCDDPKDMFGSKKRRFH